MSDWSDHVIWWHLHPITFLGAEERALPPGAEPVHRLPRLEPWLDYLVELGCNGLALGPIFASESHGYDTVDHQRIDPRLGDEHDLDGLVEACRARGVRVLLDGVFNHVGRGFGPFQDVLAHRERSRYARWFRLDFSADGPDGFGYADFEGHRHLVALDHREPEVADYVAGVVRHWLDRGVDGFRLDAAYAVPNPFWRAVTDLVRPSHPDAWFVGEVIHGDYPAVVSEGGLDSVTQYELWKAIWSSINDRNFFELSWALERHQSLVRDFVPLTFVGNHDVTRIASLLDDERHLPHALAVLFTVAGVPSIYAGDERGFRGVKHERADGDAEIRPAFPPDPSGLAPHGEPVHRLHQDLVGMRRRHPWLTRARLAVLHLENQVLAYRVHPPEGGAGLVVVLNLSEEPVAPVALAFPDARSLAPLLPGVPGSGSPEHVDPHGWAVLELSTTGPLAVNPVEGVSDGRHLGG